jgi:peptide-methionine (S)-S-oxide reductase
MTNTPAPSQPPAIQNIVLGGGCFWCVEAQYKLLPGVLSVTSGYAGGRTENPTYKEVCEGSTGHAEVIQLAFDPSQVTLGRILDLFWEAHDPTTLNRQGADVGTQYRSIILYTGEDQKPVIEKSRAGAQAKLSRPIVTEVGPLKKFYPAEGYHQDYFQNNPDAGYCQLVVRPKVEKFKKLIKP